MAEGRQGVGVLGRGRGGGKRGGLKHLTTGRGYHLNLVVIETSVSTVARSLAWP